MINFLVLWAEDSAKPPGGAPLGGLDLPLIMLAFFGLFFFLVLRPAQKRQEKERQQLLTGLKKNDRVLTTAGIYGTVITVSDKEDEIIIKVDENTRLKMTKGSVARKLSGDDAPKAESEKTK